MVPISEDRCKGYKVWGPSHTQDRAWLVERAQSVMVSYYRGAFEDLIDALTLGNFSAREVSFYEDKDITVQRSHDRRHEASQLSVLWCTINSETTPLSEQKPFPPVSWIQVWIGHTIGQRILLNLLTFPSAKGSASTLLGFCPKKVHLENILHPFVMYEHWDLIKQGWMKLYQAVLTGFNSGICFCDLGNQPCWKIETPPESAALSSKPSLSSCCGSLVLGQGRPGDSQLRESLAVIGLGPSWLEVAAKEIPGQHCPGGLFDQSRAHPPLTWVCTQACYSERSIRKSGCLKGPGDDVRWVFRWCGKSGDTREDQAK